jgi:hypothetical protein
MQLSAIRTLVGQLLAVDLDNYAGDTPSNADLNLQINRAIRIISRHVRPLFPKVTLTISPNDQIIPFGSAKFSRKMLSVDKIYKGSNQTVPMFPYSQFDDLSDFRYNTSGTPQVASVLNNTLYFDRPWDANASLIVEGHAFYAPLVNDTDEPEFDEYAHEAVAYLTAELAAQPTVSENTALNRLGIYEKTWWSDIEDLRRQVGNQSNDLLNYTTSRAW